MSSFVLLWITLSTRYRPSRDQSSGIVACGGSPSAGPSESSFPPSSAFLNACSTPSRLDANARYLPSGDQTGYALLAGPKVKRDAAPRARLYSQISVLMSVASVEPSGEIAGQCAILETGPAVASCFPERSNQVGCRPAPAPLERYVRTPVSEAEKKPTPATSLLTTAPATGTASPAVSSLPGSNGCASRFPSRTVSSLPPANIALKGVSSSRFLWLDSRSAT